jgi:hypothetical protein
MRTTLEVPDDLHRRAKAKAASEGITISSVLRVALESYAGYRLLPDARDDVVPDAGPVKVTNSVMTSDSATSVTNAPKQPGTYRVGPLDLTKTAQAKGKMGHR